DSFISFRFRSLVLLSLLLSSSFSSDATSPTALYTLSLHDALPISPFGLTSTFVGNEFVSSTFSIWDNSFSIKLSLVCSIVWQPRSEEHTSELQSRFDLVCRLLLEKKKKPNNKILENHYSDIQTYLTTKSMTIPIFEFDIGKTHV